jgi:putative ABC transport system permease protein
VFRLLLKNLLAHKRRLASTSLAVVFGVAFLSGNLVLTDTMKHTFSDLFADVNRGTDAYVRNATRIETEFGNEARGRIDAALVEKVRGVDGAKAAEGQVLGYGQLVGKDGKALGKPGQGPPTFAGNWSTVPELNPFRLVEGRAPGPGVRGVPVEPGVRGVPVEPGARGVPVEIVVDRKSAQDGKLRVGERTSLLTATGPLEVTVVGIARFGNADSAGGTSMALMTLDAAQRYVAKPGQVDGIAVVGTGGVTQAELARRAQRAVPSGVEAITGAQLTKENQDAIEQGLSQFVNFLLMPFAVIAVLVAVFSIYNTFSIIVAQRSREMALLRALGGSRRQVIISVVGEALAVGILASVVGLFAGLAVAGGLKGVLAAFGLDIPAGGLVLRSSTVVAAFVVGIGVTAVTSIVPAVKASRVPPLAAIRDAAFERTKAGRVRIALGTTGAAFGTLAVVSGVTAKGGDGLPRIGLGAVLLIVALVVAGPAVAGPISRIIGSPLVRLRGITGKLARENAMRNPRRTSGSAAALMIGVAVVALFTIFASSIKASVDNQLKKSFAGDLVIDSQTRGFGGFNPELATDISKVPEVKAASGIRTGAVKIEGKSRLAAVVDPRRVETVLDLGVEDGSVGDLDTRRLAVSTRFADENGWKLGHPVSVAFPDGASEPFSLGATFENRDVVGTDFVLSTAAWSRHSNEDLDSLVVVKLRDGVSLSEGKAAVDRVARVYPNAKVQDRDSYAATVGAQVNQILGFVYVMLALAIIIAVMGIANTLALSIHERRRELGVLRAVGQTRAQVRSMVRWESVIIAVFGTVGGLGLGTLCGWALVTAASESGFATFALPAGSLITLLILGGLAGVIAAVRPARRAARLDVLQAIAAE